MRRFLIVTTLLVVAAAGVYGARAALTRRSNDPPATSNAKRDTATVEKRDLVDRAALDGTLGYADARPLAAGVPGTLTAIAAEGKIVERGGVLYTVNGDQTVRLLYGSVPAWRTLGVGMSDGVDVRQLEQNLDAMGYDPGTVDKTFTSATASALKKWQRKIGVDDTGVLEQGSFVFLPGPRRIGAHDARLGDQVGPGATVTTTTATTRTVTIDLSARRQRLMKPGDRVRVELPTGRTVDGTVTDVGRVAQPLEDTGVPGGGGDATITVTVTLNKGAQVDGLDEAPVDVQVATGVAKGVLAVPVPTLLARAEGGYALELADGTLVPVETGSYADGWVEVEGQGIAEGTKVVTPA